MNIPPLTPPAVFPPDLPALAGIKSGAAPIEVLTQPVIVVGASIVDLSKLGQLLSASAMPQPILAASVDRVAEQGASAMPDDGFGKLLAAAQVFVDAFNQFQSAAAGNVPDPLTAPFQNVLLLAMNELPARLPAAGIDQTLLSSLAQVGIDFQGASDPIDGAQLTIDVTALQSAFNANAAGTSASLTQAFQALGQIAATFAGQGADPFIGAADLTPPASPFDLLPITVPAILENAAYPPLQDVLADQPPAPLTGPGTEPAIDPAIDPVLAPAAAPLNGQIAAASLAPPVSQSDASVGPSASASAAASPATVSNAAAVALQSSLADQALRDAFDVTAPAVPAAVAPPDPMAAAPADAAPIAATGQVAGSLNAADQLANATTSATPGISAAQLPVPLAALDDDRAPLAFDPSVAAAVAAYRLGDGAVPTNKPAQARPEMRADIGAVSKSRSAGLDPHDGSGDARRNETARNAALALAENKTLAATSFPPDKTADFTG